MLTNILLSVIENFQGLVFYVLAAFLLFSSLRVITARNPVHAALFLVLAFFSAAEIWMLLEAEFLAVTLVLVYVGAVMVMFLFVVMMLDINLEGLREGFWRWFPAGLVLAAIMVGEMVWVLGNEKTANIGAQVVRHAADYSNTKELGRLIYTEYVYAFELAAVILLVAIVAAIALTLRRRNSTKPQDPARQIAVRRKDRIRVVSVASEQRADRA
ncbi:MAG TPA: NADH-quinone oxidoreductase subunit J [Gallionellaceae bacterium]|nr:NADH-quinone oxidoreductase subunit J [Gallionellaceae bacterium]